MKTGGAGRITFLVRCELFTLFIVVFVATAAAQKVPEAKRVWSVGPLVKPQTVGSFSFGSGGATFGGMHAATRSVLFAGDRVLVAANLGMQTLEGKPTPVRACQLLSLDVQTGAVKDRRDFSDCGSLKIFATNDGHVVVSDTNLLRLTPDLKDAGSFDYRAAQIRTSAKHIARWGDVGQRDVVGSP
jgi:hypothetical protein